MRRAGRMTGPQTRRTSTACSTRSNRARHLTDNAGQLLEQANGLSRERPEIGRTGFRREPSAPPPPPPPPPRSITSPQARSAPLSPGAVSVTVNVQLPCAGFPTRASRRACCPTCNRPRGPGPIHHHAVVQDDRRESWRRKRHAQIVDVRMLNVHVGGQPANRTRCVDGKQRHTPAGSPSGMAMRSVSCLRTTPIRGRRRRSRIRRRRGARRWSAADGRRREVRNDIRELRAKRFRLCTHSELGKGSPRSGQRELGE